MSESSFALQDAKVYRLSRVYQVYHFAVGAAALIGAVKCYDFLILAVGLALLSVFMIARPLRMAVIVDQTSVTYKGMFSENSLQRSSITAFESQRTGKTPNLILWGNIDQKECLVIPDMFGFDDEWDGWLSTHKDLSDDKPISLFGGRQNLAKPTGVGVS
jgi:hypothetical protein